MSNQNQAIEYYNRGCELAKQECNREALKAFEKAVECDSCMTDAFVNAGVCSMRLQRFDESAYYCVKAIELDNNDRAAHFNYGYTLGCMDRYQEAACELEIALGMAPNDEATLLQLARCYTVLEMPRKGLKYVAEAVRLRPLSREGYQLFVEIAGLAFWHTMISAARFFRV